MGATTKNIHQDINKIMSHKPHCPVPVITYNGSLIVAAAQKYPKVAARLPAGYLTATTARLEQLSTDSASQVMARGETANLTQAQQANLTLLLHCMSQARKTARLAFPDQNVKLHQEFLIGFHESHQLAAVLARADILLAAIQSADNLVALKLKGWTDAETTTFSSVRATFPASSELQHSGQSDAKAATLLKNADAAVAYEHILTIQNAANLEFPATHAANAPIRAEFRLGLFPPDHHVAPAPPTLGTLTSPETPKI